MKKKLLCVLMVLTLLISMSATASACSANSVKKAQLATLKAMAAAANTSVRCAVAAAQMTPWDDVDALLIAVDRINAPVFAYAAKIGVDVECIFVTYRIDGRMVDVDPIRVIDPIYAPVPQW